ncbi:hypothetical protein ACFYYB_27685 [Streptomyces sp. NPDC002886]|uniref:hypothetical protein n=1 Tax=Streptomyces sp. NPDC002886 TaxID=3364667 RepID=UPI0036A4CBD1
MEAGNWYARHVLARILAKTAGHSSLAALLRAYSHDLDDDQGSLSTTLYVFAQEEPAVALEILCYAPLATMRTFVGRQSGCSASSPNQLISTC